MIKAVAFVPNTPTLIGDLGVKHTETISALRSFGKEISGKRMKGLPEFRSQIRQLIGNPAR